eukprot:scaffold319653_cov20-Prasinocladus_malaysianus.AAC.2
MDVVPLGPASACPIASGVPCKSAPGSLLLATYITDYEVGFIFVRSKLWVSLAAKELPNA